MLLAILRAEGANVVGCTALEPPRDVNWNRNIPYLGSAEALERIDPRKHVLVNGVGSAGQIGARRELFEQASEAGFRFRGVRHASATLDPGADIDECALVMAGAIIQVRARVGPNVLINTGAIIDHDTFVGAHSHIATGARIAGEAMIEESVHVGAGATIIQRAHIGRGAVVAAGAVVIRPVGPGEIHGGVPARPLATRSE